MFAEERGIERGSHKNNVPKQKKKKRRKKKKKRRKRYLGCCRASCWSLCPKGEDRLLRELFARCVEEGGGEAPKGVFDVGDYMKALQVVASFNKVPKAPFKVGLELLFTARSGQSTMIGQERSLNYIVSSIEEGFPKGKVVKLPLRSHAKVIDHVERTRVQVRAKEVRPLPHIAISQPVRPVSPLRPLGGPFTITSFLRGVHFLNTTQTQ